MILRAMTTEMIMISIVISLAKYITDLTSVLPLKVFASRTEFTAYTMNIIILIKPLTSLQSITLSKYITFKLSPKMKRKKK